MSSGAPTDDPRALAVVPARLASTRLARKMLLRETGRYLFQHTVENVLAAGVAERVVLATDSEEIERAAREVGVEALRSRREHASGTDRVQEAAELLRAAGEGPWDVVVNVQGDEPELPHEDLRTLLAAFRDPFVEIATLYTPLTTRRELEDPSAVKVVLDHRGNALYFSRSPVPHAPPPGSADEDALGPGWKRHLGVYAFRPSALAACTALPPGDLEGRERLEQLRWLEAGHTVRVLEASDQTVGIDTPDDYALFVKRWQSSSPPPPVAESTP